jgi:hypothetical protein
VDPGGGEEEERAQTETQDATAKLDGKEKAFEDDMEQKKRKLTTTKREREGAINNMIRDLQDKRVSRGTSAMLLRHCREPKFVLGRKNVSLNFS